jgi:hypothetical protein
VDATASNPSHATNVSNIALKTRHIIDTNPNRLGQKQHLDGSDKMAGEKHTKPRDFLCETQPTWTDVNPTRPRNILPKQD